MVRFSNGTAWYYGSSLCVLLHVSLHTQDQFQHAKTGDNMTLKPNARAEVPIELIWKKLCKFAAMHCVIIDLKRMMHEHRCGMLISKLVLPCLLLTHYAVLFCVIITLQIERGRVQAWECTMAYQAAESWVRARNEQRYPMVIAFRMHSSSMGVITACHLHRLVEMNTVIECKQTYYRACVFGVLFFFGFGC